MHEVPIMSTFVRFSTLACIAIAIAIVRSTIFNASLKRKLIGSQLNKTKTPSPPPEPKQLEFVHIPKTGGTAIEYAASLANITWGVCHWTVKPLAGPGCHHPDWRGYNARQNLSGHDIHWENWHVPPRHQTTLESPYKNKTLFAVVRNPYERFVSDFYCPYLGYNPVDWTQSDVRINDPMSPSLQEAQGIKRAKKPETPEALNRFLMRRLKGRGSHYLPQSAFVFDNDGTPIVDHVLKYEQLREQFAELMENYNLPVYLNSTVNKRNDHQKQARLTVNDLFPETIQRINEVAGQDFRNFGYSMIDPKRLDVQHAQYNNNKS